MSATNVRRERFLPYAYDKSALQLEVTGCTRDGQIVPVGDGRRVELVGAFAHAELDVRASIPDEIAAKLVSPAERRDPPIALLLALRCEPTRLRRGEVLALVAGEARGVLRVRGGEVSGHAELHAWIVRTRTASRRVAGFAHVAGARLASAPVWTVALQPESPTGARGIDVRYRSFSADPGIPEAERGNVYRLDAAQDQPILWINADHEAIVRATRADGTRGALARARDVVFDRIVVGVLTQLVLRAATHARDDATVYAWESAVLRDFLPALYPGVDPAERHARLAHEDPADLVGRLDEVLQARERSAKVLLAMVDEP